MNQDVDKHARKQSTVDDADVEADDVKHDRHNINDSAGNVDQC